MSMMISEMINSGKAGFVEFLKMHPFSASNHNVYDPCLQGIDFFADVYIKTMMTQYRLAAIANLVSNNNKNLVVVTGYKGCGKTNFIKYIEYIANGNKIDKTLMDTRIIEENEEKTAEGKKKVAKKHEEIKKDIKEATNGVVKDIDGEGLIEYIQNALSCEVPPTYMNFDVGGAVSDRALLTKLLLNFEDKLKHAIAGGYLSKAIRLIDGFVARNRDNIIMNFEDDKHNKLNDFWLNVKIGMDACRQDMKNSSQIFMLMKNLTYAQALFSFFLWEMAILAAKNENPEKAQLYLLDNIDAISDSAGITFRSTVFGLFSYISGSRILFNEISRNKDIHPDDALLCRYYERMNVIVAMRETSAMKATNHFRKLVVQNMISFDMSEDTDKTLIIQARVNLAKKLLRNGEITNDHFLSQLRKLEGILDDRVLMQRLFMLNNNDIRTTDQLLSKICLKEIPSYRVPKNGDESRAGRLFGMRGIVYKKVFDIFIKEDYFQKLKISTSEDVRSNRRYTFSYARILLILLYRQRNKQADRILFDKADYVDLKVLYDEAKAFMNMEDFIEILDEMYSLRDSTYWNHLVTFDNVATYSTDVLKNYLKKDASKDDKKIYVCITSAGKTYLDQVCVHFEFFAERFYAGQHKALLEYNVKKEEEWEEVKDIIVTVANAAAECALALEEFNLKVLSLQGKTTYGDIVTSHYYYGSQFHEERIIHNHIQYLNGYRRYLISEKKLTRDIDMFLLDQIVRYLDMLHTNDWKNRHFRECFITGTSLDTYNRLMTCVEAIKDSDCKDMKIDITRDYYGRHYKDQTCKELEKRGMRWRKS